MIRSVVLCVRRRKSRVRILGQELEHASKITRLRLSENKSFSVQLRIGITKRCSSVCNNKSLASLFGPLACLNSPRASGKDQRGREILRPGECGRRRDGLGSRD
jgi:hypothetical protein